MILIFVIIYKYFKKHLLESSTFSLLLRLSDKFKQTSLTGRSSKLVKLTDILYHSNNNAGFSCLISIPSLEVLGFKVVDTICFTRSNSSSELLDRLKTTMKLVKKIINNNGDDKIIPKIVHFFFKTFSFLSRTIEF